MFVCIHRRRHQSKNRFTRIQQLWWCDSSNETNVLKMTHTHTHTFRMHTKIKLNEPINLNHIKYLSIKNYVNFNEIRKYIIDSINMELYTVKCRTLLLRHSINISTEHNFRDNHSLTY